MFTNLADRGFPAFTTLAQDVIVVQQPRNTTPSKGIFAGLRKLFSYL